MLHFAPRYGIVSPCLTWGLRPRRAVTVRRPANDNGAALPGTREGANDHGVHEDALLAAALRLLQRGLIDTETLIHATYALDDAMPAFAASHKALKVLFQM
jgi:hypothetical protein